MSRKISALVAALALAGLAACSDITGPETTPFCPVTGGSGTCDDPG